MTRLNSFQNLDEFACEYIDVQTDMEADLINRRISRLNLFQYSHPDKKNQLCEYLNIWPKFFDALDTISIESPQVTLTGLLSGQLRIY